MLRTMFQGFVQTIKEIFNGVIRFLKQLFSTQPSKPVPAEDEPDTFADELPPPPPKLASLPQGIWVECSSCGLPHELQTVCHVCGAPLCDDTRYCRKFRFVEELGQKAVVCPEHA